MAPCLNIPHTTDMFNPFNVQTARETHYESIASLITLSQNSQRQALIGNRQKKFKINVKSINGWTFQSEQLTQQQQDAFRQTLVHFDWLAPLAAPLTPPPPPVRSDQTSRCLRRVAAQPKLKQSARRSFLHMRLYLGRMADIGWLTSSSLFVYTSIAPPSVSYQLRLYLENSSELDAHTQKKSIFHFYLIYTFRFASAVSFLSVFFYRPRQTSLTDPPPPHPIFYLSGSICD